MTAPSSVLAGTNTFKAGEFKSCPVRSVGATWFGSSAVSTSNTNQYIYVSVALEIIGWIIFCDTSSTTAIDVWQTLLASAPPTSSNSICNSNYIAVTAGTQNSLITDSGGVLGFASSLNVNGKAVIPAGSALVFNVNANNNAKLIRAELICRSGS
jgi:hypothetical protein